MADGGCGDEPIHHPKSGIAIEERPRREGEDRFFWASEKVTVHRVSAILSVAKDLGRICDVDEILRYAQDDRYLIGL